MKKIIQLLLLITAISMQAQTNCNYTLSGKITDEQHLPIQKVKISLEDSENKKIVSTKTDSEGNYIFSGLCLNNYKLKVEHSLFQDIFRTLNFNGNLESNFVLKSVKEKEIEGIVINKVRNKTNTVAESKISKSKIDEYSDTNLGTALSTIAGVSTLSTGNNIVKPVIHGLHSSRVPVFNNEVRQEDQEWGVEHAPDIDLNAANSISVIKGAGALQYAGDAVGGIILAEPKPLTFKDTLQGRILTSYISNGRGGNVTGSLEKGVGKNFAIRMQGTYKRLGDLSAPDYNLSNTGTKENDFSVLAAYKKGNFGLSGYFSYFGSETGILKAAHIGNLENLVNALNSRQPLIINPYTSKIDNPKQEITHRLAKFKTYYNFDFGTLDFIYGYQANNRKEFDVRRGEYKGKPSLDFDLDTHNLSLNLSHYEFKGFKGKAGLSYTYQKNHPNADTGISPLIPYYEKNSFGIYLTENYRITSDLIAEGGIRYDYQKIDALKYYKKARWRSLGYDVKHPNIIIDDNGLNYLTNPKLNYNGYAASLGLKYNAGYAHTLIFNYSYSSRMPNPGELFSDGLHHSAAAIELGDLDLKNEKANKFLASLNSYFFDDRLNLELTLHYNHIKDFINQIPVGAEYNIRGAFPVWQYVQTNADIFGVDVTAGYTFNDHWNLNTAFSYLKGDDIKNNIALINMPPAKWVSTLEYKNNRWMNFFANAAITAVFRQTHYPDYNFNVQVVENGQIVNKLLDISTPPAAYQLVDLNAGFSIPVTEKNKLNISFSVRNLFDTSYRNYLNRLRYYADETGRNFILRAQYNF